jgi:hypothetical protein
MNIWQQFQKLLSSDVVAAGSVESVSSGVYSIKLPSGGFIPAKSSGAFVVGSNVFVKNGQIVGAAPNLGAITTIEI